MPELKTNISYTKRPSTVSTFQAQNGVWVDTAPLDDQKIRAKYAIDMTAEKIRRKYITSNPGQVGTYNEKYIEAKAYKDAGYPSIGSPIDYPFIQAEVDATGMTAQDAADLIITTRNAWIIMAANIEKERRKGKLNIDSASTSTDIITAQDNAISLLKVFDPTPIIGSPQGSPGS